VKAGAIVVDNTSAFRMKDGIPLVVPEVNGEMIFKHAGLIANPNCSTIIMNVPVWPLHKSNRVKRIVVSTYQAVSGAGAWGLYELEAQMKQAAAGQPVQKEKFPHQIVNNLFSHNTKISENGYNEEENKVVEETRKMFHAPELPIVPTCIRVPVLRAHSESIVLELEAPMSPEEARALLGRSPGIKIVDDPAANHFPMPIEASGDLDVHVGRIRRDLSNPNGLVPFAAGDQLLKGAAWNAVQIAEELASMAVAAA
jgi:aspartate-semialdehyde dehydrogenase